MAVSLERNAHKLTMQYTYFALAIVVTLVMGCGSSSQMQAFRVPAPDPSILAPSETDSLTANGSPPTLGMGTPTAPTDVTQYSTDRTRTEMRLTVSGDFVEVVTPKNKILRFAAPEIGEKLDLVLRGDSLTRSQVRGTPRADTVRGTPMKNDDPSWWEKRRNELAWVGGFVLLAAVGAAVRRFVPF